MIKASVLGATGYAGVELVRLLTKHSKVQITHLTSKSYAGKKLSDVYPSFAGILDIVLEDTDIDAVCKDSDVVFAALPHGAAKEVIPQLAQRGVRIIDFSGDYRYKNKDVYEKWYGEKHTSPHLLEKAVYGLCELYREEIKNADLVGNPGCYTTCSILALAPLVSNKLIDTKSIIIDAKSGVTGAGRTTALDYSFCECTENMRAYKIATHRHTSEIEQELSILADEDIVLSFTPHLVPLKRGILATCYVNLKKPKATGEIIKIFKEFYKGERFIRIYEEGKLPDTKNVAGSNFVDMAVVVDARLGRVVVVSCLDNIVKGAAGQAIQNMNIMFGMDEYEGIDCAPFYL
jgi:N-acetyl-gamma-glutamyl-phosphate reductase